MNTLRGQIRSLNTQLAYREGILNSRGIIEKCEREHLSKFQIDNFTRQNKWITMLKRNRKLKKSVFRRITVNDNTQIVAQILEVAGKITHIYEMLSNQIHNSYDTKSTVLTIGSELTLEQTSIIAVLCNVLNVRWESSTIDQHFKPIIFNNKI